MPGGTESLALAASVLFESVRRRWVRVSALAVRRLLSHRPARRQEIREALSTHQDELLSMTRADQLRAARDHAHETFIRDETCWRGFFN